MLTGTELRALLPTVYTSEELCDVLNLDPEDIVEAFSDKIEEKHNAICERIKEDTGYGEDEEDEGIDSP